MYVIGKNDYDFIKITNAKTMYDGQKMWNAITRLEYATPLDEATIISDYGKAKGLVEEIQGNIENIKFANHSVIGEILDKKTSFDKITYAKELEIFELVPTVVKQG